MSRLILAMLLLALGAAPASAGEVVKVANYDPELMDGATEIEVAGNLAFVVGHAGVEIVSIADPAKPRQMSKFECEGAFDVALDPAAQIMVVAVDSANECISSGEGFVVADIRNPADPDRLATVEMPFGAHTLTMDGRTLYANALEHTAPSDIEIFDLSDPAKPSRLATHSFAGHGAHDSFVRHRADGRNLLYTANIEASYVLDVTNPAAPKELQRVADPRINYAHAAEVSHDDEVVMVSDEMLIGAPSGVCGKAPAGADIGALHFYAAAPDGTFANNGLDKLGTWNVPLQPSGQETCTIHVFVQSPDSRRVIAAWYMQGTRVADFTDPAGVQELGAFQPPEGRARQAIPHNGYIYTADLVRGMDVLRYTGDGWPATSGPAESFRFGPAPVKAPPALPPAMPPPSTAAGRARFTVKVPRRHRRKRLQISVTDARGVQVATLRARRAPVRIDATGLPGRYRWTARAGRRRVATGRVVIRRTVDGLSLPNGTVMRLRSR